MSKQIGERDFSNKTVKALKEKGVKIVGLQSIPDIKGNFLNSETAYKVNDNGVSKIKTYLELVEMASNYRDQ